MKIILSILIACFPIISSASQDVVREPLAIKYRYTSYGETPELSVEFAKEDNEIIELILHWNNCSIPVPSRDLKEFDSLNIDTLQMRAGEFFHEGMKGVPYINITFHLNEKYRNGNTPESSYTEVGYMFWKNKYQQVSVKVPLADNRYKCFVRESGHSHFQSGSTVILKSFSEIAADLKPLNENNSNQPE